jgi:hypothetical protein
MVNREPKTAGICPMAPESDSAADSTSTAPAAALGNQGYSIWAMLGMLFSMSICPFTTLLGVLFALRALVEIRANPGRGGRTMALSALWLGMLLTLAGFAFLLWWNAVARPLMIQGPQEQLRAAMAGDIETFREGFIGDGAAAGDEEVRSFITELRRRYGDLQSCSQKPGVGPASAPQGEPGARVIYVLQFDRESVDAIVQIVPLASGILPRFGFIIVRDPARGDLYYPRSAQDRLVTEADSRNSGAAAAEDGSSQATPAGTEALSDG